MVSQWSRFSCCSHWVNHRLCLYGLGPKSHSQKLKSGKIGIVSLVCRVDWVLMDSVFLDQGESTSKASKAIDSIDVDVDKMSKTWSCEKGAGNHSVRDGGTLRGTERESFLPRKSKKTIFQSTSLIPIAVSSANGKRPFSQVNFVGIRSSKINGKEWQTSLDTHRVTSRFFRTKADYIGHDRCGTQPEHAAMDSPAAPRHEVLQDLRIDHQKAVKFCWIAGSKTAGT